MGTWLRFATLVAVADMCVDCTLVDDPLGGRHGAHLTIEQFFDAVAHILFLCVEASVSHSGEIIHFFIGKIKGFRIKIKNNYCLILLTKQSLSHHLID